MSGYPPEDLVLKPALQADIRAVVETFARETAGRPRHSDRRTLGRVRQAL